MFIVNLLYPAPVYDCFDLYFSFQNASLEALDDEIDEVLKKIDLSFCFSSVLFIFWRKKEEKIGENGGST
jgi:hypothetical protein